MSLTLSELRKLLNAANAEYIITRKDGPLIHVNFYVEKEKNDA
jgi:hypothetical protein